MSKNPGPVRRDTRWYLRVRVPDDLLDTIGRREIWQSLNTGDHREAKRLYSEARAKLERMFTRAREGLASLSEGEIETMVIDWFRRVDRTMTESDFKARGTALREALRSAGVDENHLLNGSKVENLRSVQSVADAILIENDWPGQPHRVGKIKTRAQVAIVDKASEQYATLCEHVGRAMVEVARRQQDRLKGNPAGKSFDPMFAGGTSGTAPARTAVTRADDSLCLTEILEKWLVERKPPEKTAREWRTAVRRFGEVSGDDLPVVSITKAHVRNFKDALLRLPAKAPNELRRLTVPEIIRATAKDDVPRLTPAAAKKHLGAVSSVLSWADRNGYREGNPASGVTVAEARNARDKRLSYDEDDLKVIFTSLGQFRQSKPARFWIPLLALFTGARIEELGQLTVGDVRHDGGVDYLDINTEGDGKSLKTKSSVRQVPIHPELVRLGFLDYVAERRKAKDKMVFPDLKPDKLGTLTGNLSKWYGRHARDLGITDRRKVFHSFRHTFKDGCRAARISEEVHDALTGHAGGGVGRTYGGGVPLEVKSEEIAKVKFPGLDLSHLHTK